MQLAENCRVLSPDFPANPQRPETWIAARGEILRELPGRCVFRARLGSPDGPRIVVKEFTPRRLRHLLRGQWLPGYAETEANNALAVRARGVPVVEPLGYARLSDGRQFVILREERDARDLMALYESGELRGKRRHEIARNVGTLWAQLQNAGIQHRDPHAGNLLVRPDNSILLADAWDLRPGDYLRADMRAKALSDFALWFLKHGNMVDLLLFWGAYGRKADLSPDDLEDLRQRVLRRVPDAFRRLSRMRARKVRRSGRAISEGDWTGFVGKEISDEFVQRLAAFASNLQMGPNVLKKSPTAWTFVQTDGEGESARRYVVKVYLPKKASRAIRDFFQGTRANRAVEAAEGFFHRGIRTPAVRGVWDNRKVPGRSLLIQDFAEDADVADVVLPTLPARRARELASTLGRLLRRMHDLGLRHRDLKRDNLFLDRNGDGFAFLDLDGVRQTRRGGLDWARRARDLAVLNGSLLDFNAVPTGLRLRALDAYVGGAAIPGYKPGEFAREVLAQSEVVRIRHAEKQAEKRELMEENS